MALGGLGSVGSLFIELRASTDKLAKDIQGGMKGLQRQSAQMRKIGAGLTAAVTLPLVGIAVAAVKAFDVEAKAIAQVEAAIRTTGSAAGFTSKELQKMAADLQDVSPFGNEQILAESIAQFQTFTNIAGPEFSRAIQASMDVATRTQQDLKSTAIQLGKALNDPIANLGALGRTGIQFSEDQKTLIKSLADTGQIAAAQKIILSELETQYGGSAEAAANAGTGGFTQLKNSIGDLLEEFGKLISDGIKPLVQPLKDAVNWFEDLDVETKKWIVSVGAITAAIGPLLVALGLIPPALALIGTGLGLLATPIGIFIVSVGAIGAALFHFRKEVASIVNIVIARMLRAVVIGINDLIKPVTKLLRLIGIDLVDDLENLQKELLHTAKGMDLMAIEVLQDTEELRALQKMAEGTAGTFEGELAPAVEAVTEGSLSLSEALFGVEDRLRAQKLAASEAAEQTNDLLNTLIAFGGGAVEPVGSVGRVFRTLQDDIGGATEGIDQIIAAGNRAQTTITRSVAAQGVEWAKVKGQADKAAADIDRAMADIREAAGGIFDALLIRGESVFESLQNALKGGALSLGRAIFQDITEQLAGPILKEFRKFFSKTLGGFITGFANTLGGSISKVFGVSGGGGAASSAGGLAGISSISGGLIAGLGGVLGGVISGLMSKKAFGIISGGVDEIKNALNTYIETWFRQINPGLQDKLLAIQMHTEPLRALADSLKATGEWQSSVLDTLQTTRSAIVDTGLATVNGVKGLGSKLDNIVDGTRSAIESIFNKNSGPNAPPPNLSFDEKLRWLLGDRDGGNALGSAGSLGSVFDKVRGGSSDFFQDRFRGMLRGAPVPSVFLSGAGVEEREEIVIGKLSGIQGAIEGLNLKMSVEIDKRVLAEAVSKSRDEAGQHMPFQDSSLARSTG